MLAILFAHPVAAFFAVCGSLWLSATLILIWMAYHVDNLPPASVTDALTATALDHWTTSYAQQPSDIKSPTPSPHTSQVVDGVDSLQQAAANKKQIEEERIVIPFKKRKPETVVIAVGDYVLVMGEKGVGFVTGIFGLTYIVEMCDDRKMIWCSRSVLSPAQEA